MTHPGDDHLVASADPVRHGPPPEPADDIVTPAHGDAEPDDAATLAARWHAIQSDFIDDPHAAVAAADDLVREALHTLLPVEADTETLRQALRGYRTILETLIGERSRT